MMSHTHGAQFWWFLCITMTSSLSSTPPSRRINLLYSFCLPSVRFHGPFFPFVFVFQATITTSRRFHSHITYTYCTFVPSQLPLRWVDFFGTSIHPRRVLSSSRLAERILSSAIDKYLIRIQMIHVESYRST